MYNYDELLAKIEDEGSIFAAVSTYDITEEEVPEDIQELWEDLLGAASSFLDLADRLYSILRNEESARMEKDSW